MGKPKIEHVIESREILLSWLDRTGWRWERALSRALDRLDEQLIHIAGPKIFDQIKQGRR